MITHQKLTLCGAAAGLVLALGAPPSRAAHLDLTGGGSGTRNGAFFTTTDNQSTGTGVINPFLRLQANGTEEGYNASTNSVMPDVKTGTHTRDIQLPEIPIVVNPSGATPGSYYEFLLDINEVAGTKAELSLDKLQLYTRATALGTATANPPPGATLRYDLDSAGDTYVLLNADLTSGSGSGDLFIYIPTSNFAAAGVNDYLYFFARFGDNAASDDGFEEFAVRRAATAVPEGGLSLALMGLGLATAGLLSRRRAAVV